MEPKAIDPAKLGRGGKSGASPPAKPPQQGPENPPNRRVKLPTVIQMENVECGAAALAIILQYHGRIVPLEELRVACGVSRDGSNARNILKAARRYGLEPQGKRFAKIESLYELDFPVILHWNNNHFLVLGGFRSDKAYISDPAQGPRWVPLDEFEAAYSGSVLMFKPGPEFETGGQKPSLWAALWRRVQHFKPALFYLLLCGLFLVVPGLVTPAFTRIFIDEFLVAGRETIVRPLLTGMAITVLTTMILTALQEYFLLRFETTLSFRESEKFFQHVLRLPTIYFGQRAAGEIGSRVMINDKIAKMVTGRLATTIIDCLMVVFYAGLMFFYDVFLTVLVIVLGLLNAAALKIVARTRIDASHRLKADRGNLEGTATYGLRMVETLKSTGGEPEFFSRWSGFQAKTLRAEQKLQKMSELISVVPIFINASITAVILLFGGLKVMDGEMTVGLLVAYQSLTSFFTRPLTNLVNFGTALQELEADLTRLDDVLEYAQDPLYSQPQRGGRRDPLKLEGKVELKNVKFGYSPLAPPLLEGFDLSVEPGRRVALIGSSGSGKSTVARLIAGLFHPWEGEILFDGVPRTKLPQNLLTNSISMVDQDIFLFSGRIHDNITMWDRTIPADRVKTACNDAQIADVIETRPGAYEALVSEGGGNFSGGQRQRLEIARALASDPRILILDEATSALDAKTEELIDDHLSRRGCTCIIVAHRLSTIRDCHEIIVMEDGKIVQQGTHDSMKDDLEGHYAKLIRMEGE